ncbi:MAG: aldehyde dehydrogenase [Moraxellaceae bacterium]|jgi:glyceraldehyde-3-phosphate dehydrogenase type I|nr:aldehyde dehydrogenase [Moraxellaceae bacterium]
MALRVAINGYGRIGRNLLRAYFENGADPALEFVAINDLGKPEALAHLTRYDSTHGRFAGKVALEGSMLTITPASCGWSSCGQGRRPLPEAAGDEPPSLKALAGSLLEAVAESAGGMAPESVPASAVGRAPQRQLTDAAAGAAHSIRLFSEPAPEKLPWAELGIDLVLECTGHFRARHDAARHLAAGARKVIIGAAPFDEVDAMLVYGVNHESLRAEHRILSSVSCTTNALVPLVKLLDEAFGVESGMMTEIHAVTSDQVLLDHTHRDIRRGRAAGNNIIPTTSSSIGALRHVLPKVGANIEGYSLRVPTQNVAAIDFTFVGRQPLSVAAINAVFAREAAGASRHILAYCDEQLVSSDFNHSPYSLIFDATETRVAGRQAKVLAWYDNEWGYANRLLDLCHYMAARA